MQAKTFLNLKGRETLALISLNLLVVMGLVIFYLLVLRTRLPENNDVLGTTACSSSYIQGEVFNDKNANGVRDSGEAGISKVTVKVTTDGGQVFTDVNPGDGDSDSSNDGKYKICLNPNTNVKLEFTNFPNTYSVGPKGKSTSAQVSFLRMGDADKLNLGFGLLASNDSKVTEIGNRLWEDDGDGIQEVGEVGIRGVNLRLLSATDRTREVAKAKTDDNGEFYFNSNVSSRLKTDKNVILVIDNIEFSSGRPLNGYRTTAALRGNDKSLDSDAVAGNEFVETPISNFADIINHGIDIGVQRVRQVGVTPTSYTEPGFPACAAGTTLVGNYSGVLFRSGGPQVQTHNFNLSKASNLFIDGVVKEGHPEALCPSNDPNSLCNQGQMFESFKMELDGKEFGRYIDQGAGANMWSDVGPWNLESASGNRTLKLSHLLQGTTAESVDYKFTVCSSEPGVTPSLTASASPTASPTESPTVTATATATSTREPEVTASPTATVTASTSPTSSEEPSPTGTVTISPSATVSPTGTVTGTASPTNTVTATNTSGTPTRNPQTSGVETSTSPTGEVLGADDQRLPNSGLNGSSIPFMLGGGFLIIGSILMYLFNRRRFRIRLDKIK